jgi:hypothetical protein
MSAAGPSRGRLHERGRAQARSARPRVRAAADTEMLWRSLGHKEAARKSAPSRGSVAAAFSLAASVEVHS